MTWPHKERKERKERVVTVENKAIGIGHGALMFRSDSQDLPLAIRFRSQDLGDHPNLSFKSGLDALMVLLRG